MKVYISGPRAGVPDHGKEFLHAEYQFMRLSWKVINPASVGAQLPSFTRSEHREVCESALKACHAIYMMPGWRESEEAQFELQLAIKYGLVVLFDVQPPAYVEGFLACRKEQEEIEEAIERDKVKSLSFIEKIKEVFCGEW